MPIRYLTTTCALTIAILGLVTLAFNTNAKRANEPNENFFGNLSNPVNAMLAEGKGVGTIPNLSYFEIPVYFHIIQDTYGNGYIDESRLDAQITVLNNAFNGAATGASVQFSFWKAGVTRTTNNDWFEMEYIDIKQQESGAEHEAKRVLRQGGANALNFYTTHGGNPSGSQYRIGWGWLAEDYASNPCRDGVVVPFTTLPGGDPNEPYYAGDLPVHEVGHWLGLYHTFQGDSCAQPNDQVDDTPVHLNRNIGQCIEEDSCPSSPGIDPIHNYMTNYSDNCKNEFTRGQFERMRDQYMLFRQSSTPPSCPVVYISISDVTVNEGNSGATSAVFNVTLSRASTQTIYVNYATANGTAISFSDYFGQSSTLSFGPGQTSQSIPIQVFVDTAVEPNEYFFINLSNPRNAKIADGQGIGTILNDDAPAPAYYEIVARHSGKCLDVEGESMASGARVIQFVCGGWANQQWQVIPVGGGYNKIVARHSGKVLDVQWAGLNAGTPVWQWEENGSAAQQWSIIDVGGGYYKIIARHSGKVLDVQWAGLDNNTPVWQWDENGSAAQQWLLRPVP